MNTINNKKMLVLLIGIFMILTGTGIALQYQLISLEKRDDKYAAEQSYAPLKNTNTATLTTTIMGMTTSSTTIENGSSFSVIIYIDPSEIVTGWMIEDLFFNEENVQCVSVEPGTYWDALFDDGEINNIDGYINDIQTWSTGPYPDMNHTACYVNFTAEQAGTFTLTFGNVEITNATFDNLAVTPLSLTITIYDDTGDNQKPDVTITSPLEEEVVSSLVSITGTASDPDGSISEVHYRISNDTWTGSWAVATGTSSWSGLWDSTAVTNGSYVISARSKDNDYEYSNITSINITLANDEAIGSAVLGLETPTDPVMVGDYLEIPIYIDPTTSVGGFLIGELSFNADLLQCTDVEPGPEWTTLFDDGTIDNTAGLITNIQSGTTSTYPSINHTACILHFTVIDTGIASLYLNNVQITDETSTHLMVSTKNTSFSIQGDNQPPTITVNQPNDGDMVTGLVSIEGTAADTDGTVVKVEYKVDTGSWVTATGTTSWSAIWDTTVLADDLYTLSVRSMDDDGAYSETSVIGNVMVANEGGIGQATIGFLRPSSSVIKEDSFEITVFIDPTVAVGGWLITELSFDADLVNCDSIIPGDKWDTYFDEGTIDNQQGIISNMQTFTTGPYPDDNHTACTLHFTAIKAGTCELDINDVFISDQEFKQLHVKTIPIEITIINKQSPVADFSFTPKHPDFYDEIKFDASPSFDTDGTIVSYQWDFGDGTKQTSSSPIAYHTYYKQGVYTVILTITDDDGLTDTASKQVVVGLKDFSNLVVPKPYAIDIHPDIILRWNECFKPDINDYLSYDVYFGTSWWDLFDLENETTLVVEGLVDPYFDIGTLYESGQLDHDVTYYWRIRAQFPDQSVYLSPVWEFTTRSEVAMITVDDITATGSKLQFTVTNHASYYASYIPWTITLEFDENTTIMMPSSHQLSGFIYQIPPEKTVTVTTDTIIGYGFFDAILDIDHQLDHPIPDIRCFAYMNALSVTDVNMLPLPNANGPYSTTIGVPISFDGSKSNDVDGTILEYHWDFGDGATAEGMSPVHTYLQPGQYTLTLTITDDMGGTNEDVTTVYVYEGSYKPWTVMIYMDGDTDLEIYAIDDFLELAEAGSNEDLNIIVQFDRHPDYDARFDDWAGTKRFYVEKGMMPTEENAIMDLEEQNMGDPATLSEFINWGTTMFPAQQTMLIFWDHGNGWQGFCQDDTSDNDMLNAHDVKGVLANSLGLNTLDIIGFMNCLMANFETYYQLKDYTHYFVGSEHITWAKEGYGTIWDFQALMDYLHDSPDASDMATFMVNNAMKEAQTSFSNMSHTWSVVKSDRLPDLLDSMDTFAHALNASLDNQESLIQAVRTNTLSFNDEFIDLYHFAEKIYTYAQLNENLREKAENVTEVLDTVVEYQQSHSGSDDINVNNAHGLSLYYPESVDDYEPALYPSLDISIDSFWDDFLELIL